MLASDPQLSPGTMLLGEIRVESLLCVSGAGALYRARSTASDVVLLARVMCAEAMKTAADAFAREALVVRHLEHEGIVAPLDAGVEDTNAIVAYEPVNGPVLQTLLGTSMPLSEVARISIELAAILDHAHRQPAPLVHGVLTTSSIVLAGAARSVRLLDLGIIQALDRVGVLEDAMWEVIDPAAASPEQISRTFPIAAATDVFGLASIAYECLTGRPPFPATNDAEARALIVAGKRPSAREVRHELNSEVDRLLAKAWSVDPRSRPHDIVAFANLLGAALIRPPGVAADPIETDIEFPGDDDDAETVNIPSKIRTEAVVAQMRAAAKAPRAPTPRAQTLPFGLPKAAPSDPPPPERASPPAIVAARTEPSKQEPVAKPEPAKQESVKQAAPKPPPRVDPAPARESPRMPALDADVKTVRVVSVTGLLVAILIAFAVIIAGAFVGAGSLMAQRAPAQPAAPKPAPTPTPHVVEPAPTPTPAPTPSVTAPPPKPAEPVALAVSDTSWPELPKESGPRPSPKALEILQKKLRVAFEPCLKIPPKPPLGIPWMVHFEFDAPSGQPVLVEVSRPFKGTLGGACMLRAALDSRVPPFDGSRWAIDLRFGP